jgi:hypothetical protein
MMADMVADTEEALVVRILFISHPVFNLFRSHTYNTLCFEDVNLKKCIKVS